MNARALPLLIALLLTSSAYTAGYVGNEDFWWYLASGDVILERGGIPERDPFLYTSSERATWVTSGEIQRTWVTHSWLWTVALAELDRHFGLAGIAIASALCVGGIAVLVFRRARLDRFGLVNTAVVAMALAASASRFTPRADLATCLLLVVFLALLDRPSPLGWGRVAILAALQALWSNLHGGYPLGLFVGFAFGLGDWLDARRAGHEAGSREQLSPAAPLLVLGPLLAITSFATPPLGLERLRGAFAFARALGASASGAASNPLVEWQPTYAAGLDASAWTHALFVAIGAASFVLTRTPRRLARVAIFVGTALLGASANRFVSVFALATAWITLANLADLSPRLAERLRALRRPWLRAVHISASALAAALLLASATALWTSRRALDGDPGRSGFSSVRPEFSAPAAAAYLREQRAPGPVFNEIALGGYLIDALRPQTQLFIDTRNLSAPLLARYRAAIAGPEAWQRLDSEFGFRSVVLSNLTFATPRLRRLLAHDPGWQLAFVDPQATVFVRRDAEAPFPRIDPSGHWGPGRAPFLPRAGPGPQAALHRYGLSLLLAYLRALADLDQASALEIVASDALAATPGDPELLAFRGYARMRQERPLEAAGDFAEVVRHAPGDLSARLNLARALARAGRPDEARAQLDAAAAIEPGNAALARLRARLDSRGARH
ncbi:MAG TPA: tetratricopeptide repeat protein [Myxococcota bacterium]|nr:tetratricopeptide repeat protein [Myxococcota bacterium]